MRLANINAALRSTFYDVERYHTLQMAAALSYHFVIAVFPALIFLTAVISWIPVADLSAQALSVVGFFIPADAMALVRRVLDDVVSPNRSALLSFGLLGTLWTASGGFAAIIEALNIAYGVEETRAFWKTRPLAVALSFVVGFLLLTALAVMIVGPNFGDWLSGRLGMSTAWKVVWPTVHWSIAVGFAILAVEALYFLAPNVKQRFWATLPGAILSVACWILLSYLLGFYFRRFAQLNKTYGVLGASVGLMIWLYWTGFAMLVGAELNAELARQSSSGPIEKAE